MALRVEVTLTGPLIKGNAWQIIEASVPRMVEALGAQASAEVHQILNQRIKHPTPYYETQVTVENTVADTVVHDRGIVYGPWLEGTSSRNQRTRFKGYHAFREATQRLEREAPRVISAEVNVLVNRLNGR
jgi:hypothetical protein